MIKKLIMVVLAVLMVSSVSFAREVGGVTLPDTDTIGPDTVQLNGAGIREKWFMDIYAGGLYLKNKTNDPQKIIDADEPMSIKMNVISGLMSYSKLEGAYREGFEKSTGGNLGPLQNRIEKFIVAHKGEIKKGDIFDLKYVPGEGMSVYKNGRRTAIVKGLDFKKAVMGIWLGKEPADDGLKTAMLGK